MLVHPDFGCTHRVMIENVDHPAGPRVRGDFAENVTDAGTCRN